MILLLFALLGFWYGVAFPVLWPLAAVLVGTAGLAFFRRFTDGLKDGDIYTVLAELLGRYCWTPFALGALTGAFWQVL